MQDEVNYMFRPNVDIIRFTSESMVLRSQHRDISIPIL